MLRLADLSDAQLREQLCGAGLRLRTGPLVFCIRSRLPAVARGLRHLYAQYPLQEEAAFADFHVEVRPVGGLRALLKPQISFLIDGQDTFAPLPGDQGLPMLEWGMNWCVSGACHQYLILHAAVLERHGRALVLPAPSGSGKSTLCAALVFRGWRLLSDELTLIDMQSGAIQPLPRPVSLKNASIEVIRGFAGEAVQFGSIVKDTAKGVVGHFPAPSDALARADELAWPGWVVFPRYQAGAATQLQALPKSRCLMRLIDNAFNYNVQQRAGFERLSALVSDSACFEFSYSNLDEAVTCFEQLALHPGLRQQEPA